jgi:hypothetical protein
MLQKFGRKFSSLLLAGKAATLPMVLQQAYAATPTYQDVLNINLTQIEVPAARLRLDSLGTTYGGNLATVCSELPMGDFSVVITGLKPEDTLFLATATNTGGNEGYHSSITLGTGRLMTPVVTRIDGPAGSTLTATLKLSLSSLLARGYPINTGSRFYLQSVAFPAGAATASGLDWSRARVSPMDTISIGRCSGSGGLYF